MTREQEQAQDNDVGYHRYALRDIITDFAERFDLAELKAALSEALSPYNLDITNA